jgi:recombination associated protein RdgC
MFQTLSLHRYTLPIPQKAEWVLQAFEPCGPTQKQSVGWVPPRGHAYGPLMETIGGHQILKLVIETKKVPSDVLKRKLEERVAAIEQTTGRKPGKKERRELSEEVLLDLLPMAFATRSSVMVWFDPMAGILALDATGSKADLALTALAPAFEDLAVFPLSTVQSPVTAMTNWLLSDEYPVGFSADRACVLKAGDESKATVKYSNHDVDIAEVRAHIQQGKLPVSLALTWDNKVSFVLTDTGVLQKVTLLDVEADGEHADAFDADVILTTETLRLMTYHLIEALGGEVKIDQPKAAS